MNGRKFHFVLVCLWGAWGMEIAGAQAGSARESSVTFSSPVSAENLSKSKPLAAGAKTDTIFVLERSQNKNAIYYQVRYTAAGFAAENTIAPFWRMYAEDGRKEDLTDFERKNAYGWTITETKPDRLVFFLQALPSHPLTVLLDRTGKKAPVATMKLLNSDRILKKVYLHLTGGIIPGVASLELVTVSPDNQKPATILLTKKGNSDVWVESLKP